MAEEWTEKYRPKTLGDVVGNESAIRSVRRWAESWAKGVPRIKALVLKGQPGTGKTSAALALASDLGWDVVEMNASDHRNADSIRKVAGIGAISQTFTADGEFMSTRDGRRKLIVLDEADNLFGREDFGGAKAIVETIRESGQPVILIVNDYYELTRKASALKGLAESVSFRRLDKRHTLQVLQGVARNEGVSVEQKLLDQVAENASGDLRAAINDLQMLVVGRTQLVEGDTAEVLGDRNQVRELAESLRSMFGAATVREAQEATASLDKTPDELEKWIEESIPREMTDARDLAAAFDVLSKADVYLRRTRALQYYGMWSYARTLMTGGVALSRRHGSRPRMVEYRFPSNFIMMSRAKGTRTARESLRTKLSPRFHTSGTRFYESVLPTLVKLVRREGDLLLNLVVDGGLDEGDVAFLLGTDPGSREVTSVMERVRASSGEDVPKSPRKGKPRSRGRSLGEF